jgi:hypothetical protein
VAAPDPSSGDSSVLERPLHVREGRERRSELTGAPAPDQSGHGDAPEERTANTDRSNPEHPRRGADAQLHLRLTNAQMAALATRAHDQGLSLTALVRLLVERGLAGEAPVSRAMAVGQPATLEVAVATLLVAEEILLVLQKNLFNVRHEDYVIEAGAAARERLQATEKALEEER